MKRSILIAAVAVLCFLCTDVRAASLFGRVIEVSSGDAITVFNLNRPVRVKLLGVDAPEMDQAFGDVARKHLSDLVHDKSVVVEYSGIAADGSVTGRVLLNDADIGAQMIRDGAAWFDPNVSRLSASDREVYQQSEIAARSERRGLWQAHNPVAPWEYAKAEARKKDPVARLNSMLASRRRGDDEPVPELTNLTLLMSGLNGPGRRYTTGEEIGAAWKSLTGAAKNWHEIRPAGQNFSVMVPEEGRQLTYPVPFGANEVDVNVHIAREGASLYTVFWFSGPTYGESDKSAIDAMVRSDLIRSAHKSYENADRGHFFCGQERKTDVSMNGYTGTEFDLSSCLLPTRARAFTKVVDDQRLMYVALVFYGDEEENVTRFVRSFRIGGPTSKTRRR